MEDRLGRARFDETMKTTTLIITLLTFASVALAQDERENPKHVIEMMMHKANEAKQAGRMEEAQKIHAEAERMMAQLKGREAEAKSEKHPGKGGPEGERLRHVMEAVEHLKAAGLHEPAKSIEEIAQHMRREMEEHMKRQQAEAQHREKEGKAPSDAKPQAELEELRQQMRRMAAQLEQLQGELKKRAQ